jgi:hypothetical protein
VVDCTGLENRRLEKVREFESHRFRQNPNQIKRLGAFFVSTIKSTVHQDLNMLPVSQS